MSVAVAITVTIPNTVAGSTGIVAVAADFTETIGKRVTDLVKAQCSQGQNLNGATVATVVT